MVSRARSLVLSVVASVVTLACASAQRGADKPVPPDPTLGRVPFSRVEHWRYAEFDQPLTPAEDQLRRHFEGVFPHARYSREYTCHAREYARFRAQHAADPEESLASGIGGRCRMSYASGHWTSLLVYSDGTLLDRPLPPELLSEISDKFLVGLPELTMFGISAEYVGRDVLVLMHSGAPQASMSVSVPDARRDVRVEGTLAQPFDSVSAVINQGEFGTERCGIDPNVSHPGYALTCTMAEGDDEAWITVTGADPKSGWEKPLAHLPAHSAQWVAPTEYRRLRSRLSTKLDSNNAILAFLNAGRAKLGRAPLAFAKQQSLAMQPAYERMFRIHAQGVIAGDDELRQEMMRRGASGKDPVEWGRLVVGTAFDGDAGDWMNYRMQLPLWREALMAPQVDLLALTSHIDPSVGFGAAAVVYSRVTPERQRELADRVAELIAKARGKRRSLRSSTPAALARAAEKAMSGVETPEAAFRTALEELKLDANGKQRVGGFFLDSSKFRDEMAAAEIMQQRMLTYGVVVTHHKYPGDYWMRPVVFVWFLES
jgi:hypothetical protein